MDAAREFGGKLFDAIFSRDTIGCRSMYFRIAAGNGFSI
jgi:hypothetical protein